MTEETGGTEPHGTPPSFIPSAGRRKSTSQSRKPAAQGAASQIPSFSPAAKPARSGTGVSGDAPRSFQPSATRPSNAPRRITPSNRDAQSHGDRTHASQTPASFAPANARTGQVRGTTQISRASSAPAARGASAGTASAVKMKSHNRHNPGRIALTVLLVLIMALGLSVFSAWNWVDGQLNKKSWLTSKADTAGESWLILGSDERDGTTGDTGEVTGFRTDTILVLTKPASGPSSLISIPRDSLVEIDQQYMKINAVAQLYSGKQLVNEVEDITGQKINHVALIQFGGLAKVVDALGGVELCYDQDVDDPYSSLNWTAGCHTADGNTALAFSRMRYADAQGDFGRAARQRQVINAIVKKAASRQTLMNFAKAKTVAQAALSSVTVDEKASTASLLRMALAFKSASGDKGISGSVYWTDPDYYVDGVGSSVLLDEQKNLDLFSQLATGKHASGTVGPLAEQS